MDGVSITHDSPRNYIWSFVGGAYEDSVGPFICPCSHQNGKQPPSFIGDNYYCESGNPNDTYQNEEVFSNDILWDGKQCEGTCCNTKSPHGSVWNCLILTLMILIS